MYTAHLDALTVEVHSPFFERRHHRTFRITPHQYRLVAKIASGWKGSQRDLAAATGYSLGGLTKALASLRGGGVIAMATRRGKHGWSRFSLQAGVHLANVRSRSNALSSTPEPSVQEVVSDASLRWRTLPSAVADVLSRLRLSGDVDGALLAHP